jgi:hypothetical protein
LRHDGSRFDVVLPAIKSPVVIPHEIDERDLSPVFAMGSLERPRHWKRLDFARPVSPCTGRVPHEEDDETNEHAQAPRRNGGL